MTSAPWLRSVRLGPLRASLTAAAAIAAESLRIVRGAIGRRAAASTTPGPFTSRSIVEAGHVAEHLDELS